MKMGIYCVYDSAAEFYNKPFYMQNQAVALRMASDLRNDPETEPGKHPHDFAMFEMGHFDGQTGEFEIYDAPVCIARFHEIPLQEERQAVLDQLAENMRVN